MINGVKETTYSYDDFTTIATIKTHEGRVFKGVSKCAPEDRMRYSKDFGEQLARCRAIDKMIDYNCKQIEKAENKLHTYYIEELKKIKKMRDRVSYQDSKNDQVYLTLQEELNK